MSEPDEITMRRIWQLEADLAALKRLVTSPTTVLSALESDRKENERRFDAVERRLADLSEGVADVKVSLAAMERQLSAIVTAVAAKP